MSAVGVRRAKAALSSGCAGSLYLPDDRQHIRRVTISVALYGRRSGRAIVANGRRHTTAIFATMRSRRDLGSRDQLAVVGNIAIHWALRDAAIHAPIAVAEP
jgi:hypothetical protein